MADDFDTILAKSGGLPPEAFTLPYQDSSYSTIDNDIHNVLTWTEATGPSLHGDLNNELFGLGHNEYSATGGMNLFEPHDLLHLDDQMTRGENYSAPEQPSIVGLDDIQGPIRSPVEPIAECKVISHGTIEPEPVRRNKISARARKILEDCFKLELYPSKTEVSKIAGRTKMTTKQVSQWFGNKRRRTTPEEMAKMHAENSKTSLPLTERSLELHDRKEAAIWPKPLEIPEHQRRTLSLSDFHSSGASSRFSSSSRVAKTYARRKGRRSWKRIELNWSPGRYLVEPRHRYNDASLYSEDMLAMKDENPLIQHDGDDARDWQDIPARPLFDCSFCRKKFKTKYSWKRHEESVHIQTKVWVCQSPSIPEPATAPVPCPYCHDVCCAPTRCNEGTGLDLHEQSRSVSPGLGCCYGGHNSYGMPIQGLVRHEFEAHLTSHKHDECRGREEQDRTFFRKEHAVQHMVNFHRYKREKAPEGWLTRFMEEKENWLPPGHPALKCPFCTAMFETWLSRVDHVGSHLGKHVKPVAKGARDVAREFVEALWCQGSAQSERKGRSHFAR